MQLGIALTPAVWVVILFVIALGALAVRRARQHGWWILAGVAMVLAATNPSAASHNDALHREVRSTLRRAVDGEANGLGRIASSAFQRLGGDAVLDLLFDVEYENFMLFSRTTMDGDVVSVGVLGNVFVSKGPIPSGH